jgi:hypothetical protein
MATKGSQTLRKESIAKRSLIAMTNQAKRTLKTALRYQENLYCEELRHRRSPQFRIWYFNGVIMAKLGLTEDPNLIKYISTSNGLILVNHFLPFTMPVLEQNTSI